MSLSTDSPPPADAGEAPATPDQSGEQSPPDFDDLAHKVADAFAAKAVAAQPALPSLEDYEALLEAQRQSARREAEQAATRPRPADRPYWVPAGDDYDLLPSDLQQALVQVINPVYEQLVLKAAPGLAQSTGLTIVHLMWLETLEHIELARLGYAFETLGQIFKDERHAVMERNLRTVTTKLKASRLLADYERNQAALLQSAAPEPRYSLSNPPYSGWPFLAPDDPRELEAGETLDVRPDDQPTYHADGSVSWPDGARKRPGNRWEFVAPHPLAPGSNFRLPSREEIERNLAAAAPPPAQLPAVCSDVAARYGPEFAAMYPGLHLTGGRLLPDGDRKFPGGWLLYPDGRLECPEGHVYFPVNWSPPEDPEDEEDPEDLDAPEAQADAELTSQRLSRAQEEPAT